VSDVELTAANISRSELAALEEALAAEIRAGRSIRARFVEPGEVTGPGVRTRGLPPGHRGPVRLVEIEGLDLNTCGGTHLRSTAEIGTVALLGAEPLRGGTRIHFLAGDRVRRRLAEQEERCGELRALLGVPDEEIPVAVAGRQARQKEASRRERRLLGELAEARAALLAGRPEPALAEHHPERDAAFLRGLGKAFQRLAPAKVALLTAGGEGEVTFLVAAGRESGVDLARLGPAVADALGGRGGGQGGFYQGKGSDPGRRVDALDILLKATRGG
jgi:alanyl-tRNA synthetase